MHFGKFVESVLQTGFALFGFWAGSGKGNREERSACSFRVLNYVLSYLPFVCHQPCEGGWFFRGFRCVVVGGECKNEPNNSGSTWLCNRDRWSNISAN